MIQLDKIEPVIIEITLHRNNWFDNKFLTVLKNYTRLYEIQGTKDFYVIHKHDVIRILNTKFKERLDYINSLKETDLFREANSIYFIDKIVNNFKSLQYIRIKVSNKRNFTRLKRIDDKSVVLDFDFKVCYAKVDLRDFLEPYEIEKMKRMFDECGLIERTEFYEKNYFIKPFDEIMDKYFSRIEQKEEYEELINRFLDAVDIKLEDDNSTLLIVF